MINQDNKNDILFIQRLSELSIRATERFCPEFTNFLDGRALRIAKEYLTAQNENVLTLTYGGFDQSERQVVGVFPKDIYGYSDVSELEEMFEISGIVIKGSGFNRFSHRDVLGSLLGLGIKRETLGDIFVESDGKCAYVCLTKIAAEYVAGNLEFVAKDKVNVSVIKVTELPAIEKKFAVISGTVASERLDCILSLATNLSREKAKQLIVSGLVNVNHFEETRCDITLEEGDILSVRGYGRFKIAEFGGITKKGRNRIAVHKMI